jgi:hypothetical protein
VIGLLLLSACCGARLDYDTFRTMPLNEQLAAYEQARRENCVREASAGFLDLIALHGYEAADSVIALVRRPDSSENNMVNFGDTQKVEILPGRGIGAIHFGMTPAKVEEKLGKPLESAMEDDYLVLEYPDGLYLFFDRDGGFRLGSLEADRRFPCSLFNEAIFTKDREQILELISRRLSRFEMSALEEEEDEGLESRSLWVSFLGVRFYFDLSDRLQEIQWGPLFGLDDEIIWPASPGK